MLGVSGADAATTEEMAMAKGHANVAGDAPSAPAKTYLGDGVYASIDDHGTVTLETDTGLAITNRIVLEPEVMRALERFVGGEAQS